MKPIEPMDCDQVFARLDDYLDRELGPDELTAVEEHIRACEYCALDERFERAVIEEIKGKLRRIAVPHTLAPRLFEQIRRLRQAPP